MSVTAAVIDLAERRAQRDEAKEIERLMVEAHALHLQLDPERIPRVIAARTIELLEKHGEALEALRPVLRELYVLWSARVLVDRGNPTTEDGVMALATVAASLTDTPDLARNLPALVAELRAKLPAEARRFEKLYGVDLFKKEEPCPTPST